MRYGEKQYVCIKCGCEKYESGELKEDTNNFSKIFDQDKRFITISCTQCGYTELYKYKTKNGFNIFDFLISK
ncbi:DNA-binding protein [Clostridium botulinum]|nr:zinc ribbon domain-containing protein [Clostridium botulinum]QPW58985.1 DNA-binding protein [Clostridium botulinum]